MMVEKSCELCYYFEKKCSLNSKIFYSAICEDFFSVIQKFNPIWQVNIE